LVTGVANDGPLVRERVTETTAQRAAAVAVALFFVLVGARLGEHPANAVVGPGGAVAHHPRAVAGGVFALGAAGIPAATGARAGCGAHLRAFARGRDVHAFPRSDAGRV